MTVHPPVATARPAPDPTRRLARGHYVVIGAMLLLQLVWVFVVPPFRGTDEFDHAYKAAASARGQIFVTPTSATRGTGAWLEVPTDLVAAARPECESLRYTKPEDCRGTRHGGTTRIASGAGRYHPAFYVLIGLPALPFQGVWALYVMRLTTVVVSTLLFALALAATTRWARGRWPVLGLVAACTPIVLYSSAVAAPNGPEMMAALAFWTSVLGLLLPGVTRHRGFLGTAAGISGAVLATLRPLGPLWCLLAVGLLLVALRPGSTHLRGLLRSRSVLVAGAAITASALQATWWILAKHALEVGVQRPDHPGLGHALAWASGQAPLWVFQSIAAFPFRDEPTKPVVYFSYLVIFLTAMVLGLRRAPSPARRALVLGLVLAVALPFALAVQSYGKFAGAWQGRYGLPFAMGLVVLAAHALDRTAARVPTPLVVLGLPLFVVAQSVSPVDVLQRESVRSPMAALHLWPAPSPWLAAVVALVASATLWWGAARPLQRSREAVVHDQ